MHAVFLSTVVQGCNKILSEHQSELDHNGVKSASSIGRPAGYIWGSEDASKQTGLMSEKPRQCPHVVHSFASCCIRKTLLQIETSMLLNSFNSNGLFFLSGPDI